MIHGVRKACQNLADVVSLEDNDLGDPESFAQQCFGESHATSIIAMKKNGWKPTLTSILGDVQKACVEHGHGGLWNAMEYTLQDVISIDMKACYPASFLGEGEAAPWFKWFGHPGHCYTWVSISGPLPKDIGTGFAKVQEWDWKEKCHPVIPAWFGRHFAEKRWAPTQLLTFLVETGLLLRLRVREALLAFERQSEIWLPEGHDVGCAVIGKFTQGKMAGGKRLT